MGWREAERSERRGEWLEKWLRGYARNRINKVQPQNPNDA
jgi:hypothetical protein